MLNRSSIINCRFLKDSTGRIDCVNDYDLSKFKRMCFPTNNKVGLLDLKVINGKILI